MGHECEGGTGGLGAFPHRGESGCDREVAQGVFPGSLTRTQIVIPAKAGIQYAAASRLITDVSGILDHPLSRMMTAERSAAACLPPHLEKLLQQRRRFGLADR